MSLIDPRKKTTQTISYTDREIRGHVSWCHKNDIIIYFDPIDNMRGRIVVQRNGIAEPGAHIYKHGKARMYKKDEKWSEIIFKLYTQIYEEQQK